MAIKFELPLFESITVILHGEFTEMPFSFKEFLEVAWMYGKSLNVGELDGGNWAEDSYQSLGGKLGKPQIST